MNAADWLDSFPKRLGILTAAIAATSAFVFPAMLIPANLGILGPIGSLLAVIVFLVAWAIQTELTRRRSLLFAVLGTTSMLSLVTLIHLNTSYVVTTSMGDPPEERRFLVGKHLTDWGEQMKRTTASADDATLVERIGERGIAGAWGDSLNSNQKTYILAYLCLGVGLILMFAIALSTASPAIPAQEAVAAPVAQPPSTPPPTAQ